MIRCKKKKRARKLIRTAVGLTGVLLFLYLAAFRGPAIWERLRGSSQEETPPVPEEKSALDSPQTADSYLLPTDREYITYEDLDQFDAEEIVLIRNEIYARHGYDFQNGEIRAYFDSKSWYEPVPGVNASTFSASILNEYESANIGVILTYEADKPAPDAPPPRDADAPEENLLTDRLASKSDVKSYPLQMSESGDAVIFVTGLQEAWDGYAYHWRCTVYEDGMETTLASSDVRGYSVNNGPAVISLPDLEAGTYRIQMESAISWNPFLATFTEAPYQIRFIRYYHSTPLPYDGGGVQTFQKADELLWAHDGTGFLKLNDGQCYGALMRTNTSDRTVVPVLFSTDPSSVEYVVSSTGERILAQGPWHCQALDVDYYYSACQSIDRYTGKSPNLSSLPILYVDATHPETAVETIVTMMEDEKYKEEHGELKFLWMKHGGKVKAACGAVGALILLILLGGAVGGSGGGGREEIEIDRTGTIDEAITDWWADGM